MVAGLISNGGDHGIHCWWDLIRLKQLSSVSVCCSQVFAGFSSHGNSIHNIIPLLNKKRKKKRKCTSNSSIWPIERTLFGATTPGQSGPRSIGNEGVLYFPQSSSITGTSPSDCLVSYPGHWLGEGSYPSGRCSWCILKSQLTELLIIEYFLLYICLFLFTWLECKFYK